MLYRVILGQPGQELLLESIKDANWDQSKIKELIMNLSPYQRQHNAREHIGVIP